MKPARTVVRMVMLAAVVLGASSRAEAQGWAARAGANVNPDQVFVGAGYDLPPLAPRLSIQPGGDIGFGSGMRLLAANFDVLYRVWQPARGPWYVDVGGGPTISHYRWAGSSETDAGMSAVGALVHARGWGAEFRVGFMDSPEFRAGVTYRWARRATAPRPRR